MASVTLRPSLSLAARGTMERSLKCRLRCRATEAVSETNTSGAKRPSKPSEGARRIAAMAMSEATPRRRWSGEVMRVREARCEVRPAKGGPSQKHPRVWREVRSQICKCLLSWFGRRKRGGGRTCLSASCTSMQTCDCKC
eukprot:568761-Rhodomonas_salina.3